MRFTIRPGESTASGGFAVVAEDAREALDHVRGMLERGLVDIDVLGPDGRRYGLIELERMASEIDGEGS